MLCLFSALQDDISHKIVVHIYVTSIFLTLISRGTSLKLQTEMFERIRQARKGLLLFKRWPQGHTVHIF